MVTVPTIVVALALAVAVWLPIGLLVRDLVVKVTLAWVVGRYDVDRLRLRTELLLEEGQEELSEALAAAGVPAALREEVTQVAGRWALGQLRAAVALEYKRRDRDARDRALGFDLDDTDLDDED